MSERRALLECEGIYKRYQTARGGVITALDGVSLRVFEREFLCIAGSSGSGKSTLLRILAGLESPTQGLIRGLDRTPSGRVGFVFQDNSVFPWRTVERNLTYSLEARGTSKEVREQRAVELCKAVGLQPSVFLKKYPRELSGGEARRVALGMALSADAPLLILDEPTSQLDYVSRAQLQRTIHALWNFGSTTVVCVTHDIEEAILLGERIVVLGDGRIRDSIEIPLPFPRAESDLSSDVAREVRERTLRCFGDRL